MSSISDHISSDDAAIFQANLPDQSADEDTDTEDPIGRTASKAGQLDMFRAQLPKVLKNATRGGSGVPLANGFQMTPGEQSGLTGSGRPAGRSTKSRKLA